MSTEIKWLKARSAMALPSRGSAIMMSEDDFRRLVRRDARGCVQALEIGEVDSLAVHADDQTMWVWLRWPPTRSLRLLRAVPEILVAVGRPGTGLEGSRNSHVEAAEALRVACIAGQPPGNIIYYDDVEIASLCSGAGELRARHFIESELGGLAADTEVARQTRQTLLAFYSANSNFRATAVNLGVHHNTVRYRLEVAERILGRRIESRRLITELALHLLCAIGQGNSQPQDGFECRQGRRPGALHGGHKCILVS